MLSFINSLIAEELKKIKKETTYKKKSNIKEINKRRKIKKERKKQPLESLEMFVDWEKHILDTRPDKKKKSSLKTPIAESLRIPCNDRKTKHLHNNCEG